MCFCLLGTTSNNILRILLLLVLLSWFPALAKRYKKPWFCDNKLDGDPQNPQAGMSFLWSVRRDPPAYFFGTIHVPYTRVWDFIPDVSKQAFESADNVFFELDLLDPGTISALASCQMLPKGNTLINILPQDMFRRLKVHLDYVKVMMPTWLSSDQRGRGLYAEYLFNTITGNWERKRPVWVMLMVNALTESDVKSRGIPVLDLFLAQEAERLNKRTGSVEKVEEQCLPLNGLNLSQVLFALNQTLVQHEGLRGAMETTGDGTSTTYTTDDLIKHYNCGDLNAAVFSQDTTQVPALSSANTTGGGPSPVFNPGDSSLAKDIDDYFRAELIYKRNRRMGNRVAQLLKAYPDKSFFFAFGAGHYLGNDTVLDFVQRAGFQVDHVPPHKKIRGSKRSRENRKASSESSWMSGNAGPLSDFVGGGDNLPSSSEQHPPSPTATLFGGARGLGRGPRPHSSVTLLRTTPPPPPPRAPRKFNDLWVRIGTFSTREPYTSSREAKLRSEDHHHQHHEAKAFENSLRMWYGLTSDAAGCHPTPQLWFFQPPLLLLLLLLGVAAGIT